MIGVVVRPSERGLAQELFELFKTPWEFYRPGWAYDVVITTSTDWQPVGAKLVLVFNVDRSAAGPEDTIAWSVTQGGAVRTPQGKRVPIYGKLGSASCAGRPLLTESSTNRVVAFVVQINGTTILRIGYSLFDEMQILFAVGQPVSEASIPTLEEHIGLIRDWITGAGLTLVEIPPIPDGHSFMACLTHDVDHPTLRNHGFDHTACGFFYRATIGTLLNVCRGRKPVKTLWRNWRAACSLPLVQAGVGRDLWSEFDRYLDIEAGLGSTYFVIPRKAYSGRTSRGRAPAMRACRYELADLTVQMKRIIASGSEIGVHGLDAWLDDVGGREEKEKVARATGNRDLGVRMHWLYFDEDSPAVLDRAGFDYDSSVGYCDGAGFRAGTAQAYKPPGAARLLELPLHVMDTALFYPRYMNLRESDAAVVVQRLIEETTRTGGALTLNWHDRSIAPERLWGDFYIGVLAELKSRGAWFPTASQAVAWFRKRRAAVITARLREDNRLAVSCRQGASDALPGLRLRIHRPRAQSLLAADAQPGLFLDVPIGNGQTEFTTLV